MIGAWLPPPSLRRLLPDQKKRIAPWIVGLMTFVSLIVGAAGLGLLGAVEDLRAASAGRWSLQVAGSAADGVRATALVRADKAVASVAPVPAADVRRSLEDWLGPAAGSLDLPLPMLADVTLAPAADGRALAARLRQQVPSAQLTPYADELRPLLGSLEALTWLVIGLLMVLALAMAAAVTLAARATLEANRATLDIFHGIGATDAQLLALVQRRIALDSLIGGLIGGLAAAGVLMLALVPARGLLGGLGGPGLLTIGELSLLALLPMCQAALATAVARRALKQALTAIP